MSYDDYRQSQDIEKQGYPFYALIMAAIRQADNDNRVKLVRAFPSVFTELCARYRAPGGVLPGELVVKAGRP